ncbi:Nucleolar MIF4G domain-containing protein 1 [Sparganum proliferum]
MAYNRKDGRRIFWIARKDLEITSQRTRADITLILLVFALQCTLSFETNLSKLASGATLGCASVVAESQKDTSPKKRPSRTTNPFGADDDDDNDAKEAERASGGTDVAPTPVNTDADENIEELKKRPHSEARPASLEKSISFSSEIDALADCRSARVHRLVEHLEASVIPQFNGMTKMPWNSLTAVNDQFAYATTSIGHLMIQVPIIRDTIFSVRAHFTQICIKLADSFISRLRSARLLIYPHSSAGSPQLSASIGRRCPTHMKNQRTKKRLTYTDRRKQQLLADNEKEEAVIKKLSKKLGLNRRKKNGGTLKQPAWMRDSGLEYLLGFNKYVSDHEEQSVEGKSLGVGKSTKQSQRNIYGQDSEVDDVDAEESMDTYDEDSSAEDLNAPSPSSSNLRNVEETKDSSLRLETSKAHSAEEGPPGNWTALRKNIRRLLNCVSEAQMSRAISDITSVFADNPRGIVRSILIEEVDVLLKSFPFSRSQSVGWLQQELAACFLSIQARLDQAGQGAHLVAHIAEYIVGNIPQLQPSAPIPDGLDGGLLASRVVFLSYLYRFGGITGDLIFDLVDEFLNSGQLPAMQAAHQMLKPISSVIRKELVQRCQEIHAKVKGLLSLPDQQEFDKVSELESILTCLSEKRSQEPALSSADHFVKMMRTWNKGISFPKEARLPLHLVELRNPSEKGRWWLVGSAFHGEALNGQSNNEGLSSRVPDASVLTKELADAADRLGLITPLRRQLFALLMSTPGGPDSTAAALLRASDGEKKSSAEHREREVVHVVLHCLISEQPFNRFYPRVLGGLLNHQRQFGLLIRCAFWDVMSKEYLTREAKSNIGKAIGMLSVVYDFSLVVLKKFNFGDASVANTSLLSAVLQEFTGSSFGKTLQKFAHFANAYPKVGRNLRIFMRKLSSTCDDEAFRAFLLKLASELRDLVP